MSWILVDTVADIQRDGDRWLLVYNVPTEYAPDGTYSVSYPADMINHWSVTYGYDLNNDDDIEDLFEHLFYQPYINEVSRIEGRLQDANWNPYEVPIETARSIAKSQIDALKENHSITFTSAPKSLGAAARPSAMSMIDKVKNDMKSRAMPELYEYGVALADEIRTKAQEDMIDIAYRMNESRSNFG